MRNPDDKGKHLPLDDDSFGAMVGAMVSAIFFGISFGISFGIGGGFGGGIGGGFSGAFVGGIGGGFSGAFVGAIVGGWTGGRIRTFFWGIGVDVGGKATCNGCSQEVDRNLVQCSSCGTVVRYPSGTTPPQGLTPTDLVLLEMTPKRNEELHRTVRVLVDDPPFAGIERLLATALLANEEAGALRLELVREKKITPEMAPLAPLRVVAVAVRNATEWPAGSLESTLGKSGAVSDIIYDWIGEPSGYPRAMKRIMAKMVNRTLMGVDKSRSNWDSGSVLLARGGFLRSLSSSFVINGCWGPRPRRLCEVLWTIF